MKSNCNFCNNEFEHTSRRIKQSKSGLIFCSRTCKNRALKAAMGGNSNFVSLIPHHYKWAETRKCVNCNTDTRNPKFCRTSCQSKHRKKTRINQWLNGEWDGNVKYGLSSAVRAYLLQAADYKCSLCGWGERNPFSGNIPIEVDHIDGNHMNNKPENLRVICPNCHALTSNYKSLNRGKIVDSKYKMYREQGWW